MDLREKKMEHIHQIVLFWSEIMPGHPHRGCVYRRNEIGQDVSLFPKRKAPEYVL